MGQIPPVLVSGQGEVGLNEQPLSLGFELSAEPLLPGGGFQRGQVVARPLAQIGQQMPDRARFGGAVGLLQCLAQRRRQRRFSFTAGPAAQ